MKIILFIAFLVVGIIFANQNDMPVTVKYFSFVLKDVTLYSVILMSVLVGFVVGAIYSYIDGFKVKAKLKYEQKQRKGLEKELASLRTLPLTTDSDIDEDDDDDLFEEEGA